jgi:hypothetical protein
MLGANCVDSHILVSWLHVAKLLHWPSSEQNHSFYSTLAIELDEEGYVENDIADL